MDHNLKVAIVVTLLVVVVFVVVHPLVDLEPTVVRHLPVSVLLLVAVVLACNLAVNQVGSVCHSLVPDNFASLRKDSLCRIDLTCTRLC
jgi:hypothetical protein